MRQKTSWPVWAWALIAGGILVVGCAGVSVVGLLAYKTSQSTTPAPVPRDEFKKSILGKTESQVLDLLGQPVYTNEVGPSKMWQYEGRTFDPTTGKTDNRVSIFFRGGKVDSVNY